MKEIILKVLGVVVLLSGVHNLIAYFGTEINQIISFTLGVVYSIAGVYILNARTKKAHN